MISAGRDGSDAAVRYVLIAALAACSANPVLAPVQPDTGTPPASADSGATPETGAADAASRDCTRAGQARTAPASLYDALLADLKSTTSRARVDQFVADVVAQGGAPLEDPGSDRVVFLARGAPPQGPWSVAGSFTSWKTNALPMTNVAGTDLFVLDTKVARGAAHAYKLLSGTADSGFREDPLAANIAWDGVDHQAPGEFNAIAHASDAPLTKGRLVRWRVPSIKLGDARDVFVYFPPAWDDGTCARRPVLVFHDGNESLTRGDFASAADEEYASAPSDQAVLVFVALSDQSARTDTYTFGTQTARGAAYVDFLASELVPRVRALHVCTSAASTGVAGASLGGLISSYAAFERPDVFGFVGSQSGSYWWNNEELVARVKSAPKMDGRFYVDHGCPDDNCASNRDFVDALSQKGYPVVHVEDPNAQHDWSFWKKRLPKLLHAFRDGQTACE